MDERKKSEKSQVNNGGPLTEVTPADATEAATDLRTGYINLDIIWRFRGRGGCRWYIQQVYTKRKLSYNNAKNRKNRAASLITKCYCIGSGAF